MAGMCANPASFVHYAGRTAASGAERICFFSASGFRSAGCRELVYRVAVSQFAAIDFGGGGYQTTVGKLRGT